MFCRSRIGLPNVIETHSLGFEMKQADGQIQICMERQRRIPHYSFIYATCAKEVQKFIIVLRTTTNYMHNTAEIL